MPHMHNAMVDGQLVWASADSPDKAACPACGEEVVKRQRRRMDGEVAFYYRHVKGAGKNCPRRYHPTI